MPVEHYFIRAKEEFKDFNVLMVVSQLRVQALNHQGEILSVSSNHSYSEEFLLDNIPNEISNLEEVTIKISPEKFDHLCNLYENDIKKFLYHIPNKEDN